MLNSSCRDRRCDSVIITSSSFIPTSATFALLRHPPKFSPTPSKCCHLAIKQSFNDFARKLQWRSLLSKRPNVCRFPSRTKSSAFPPRSSIDPSLLRCCRLLESAVNSSLRHCSRCFPPSNLSAEEQLELRRLREDRSITILPADKGGKWVILPTDKYVAEAERQLRDEKQYRATDANIDFITGQRLKVLLLHLRNTGFISVREFRALSPPPDFKPRRFYLLPKVHKDLWPDPEMPPGRPIVSDVGSVSRACASFIDFFLSPIAQAAPSYLRDSHHLLAILRDFSLSDKTIFFTMDVNNLYNNIPTEGGILAVSRAFRRNKDPYRPDLTLISMLRLLLTSNAFRFGEQQFVQLRGTPMGSAYSGSFANIFMTEWEEKVMSWPLQPRLWCRFIDDIFGLWEHGLPGLLQFLAHVNSIESSITVELHFDRQTIRFLDLELYRFGSSIGHRIGFKSTDSHMILPPSSFHPNHVFRGILFGQILRWATKSFTADDFIATKRTIIPIWRRLGYSRSSIRNAIRDVFSRTGQTPSNWTCGFFPCNPPCDVCVFGAPCHTINDSASNNSFIIAHRLFCTDRGVIYCITCKTCSMRYIGQTSRPLYRRIKEHLSNIRARRDTPVARHFLVCGVDAFSFCAIERVPGDRQRLIKETAWMRRLHTIEPAGMNSLTHQPGPPVIVLPHSQCADRCLALCRDLTALPLIGAKRRSPNLGNLLKT